MRVSFVKQIFLLICLFCPPIGASVWTDYWTEDPTDPIYNPIPTPIAEDYFVCVVYDADKFSGHGDAYTYKMWHQGNNLPDGNGALAYSYSNDGINWTLVGQMDFGAPTISYHPSVVYDANAFGGSGYYYKIWFWTGSPTLDASSIHFSQSVDGIHWETPVAITQNPAAPIAVGVYGAWFYHLYGPGNVWYKADATCESVKPMSHPYVMFFDTATEGGGPGTSVEQVGLAYSMDGLDWTRYGTEPVLIPSGNATDWDGSHIFNGTFLMAPDGYHMFYTGSNDLIDPITTVPYAHGLGVAHSSDGVNWTRDSDNPIFIYSDGVPWRDSRTYMPSVVYDCFCRGNGITSTECTVQMWFSGGTGTIAGTDQGIGYATMPNPPVPPTNFVGVFKLGQFLNRTVCLLEMTWDAHCCNASYNIYKNGTLFASVPKTAQQAAFVVCSDCSNPGNYELSAVSMTGAESTRIPLVIVS